MEVRASSSLAAGLEDVAAAASTLDGVNAELAPWVRMTGGRGLGDLRTRAEAHPPGTVLLRCWMLALGVVPFDRHALALARIVDTDDEQGFDERSTSWLQGCWHHDRRIRRDGDGCTVTDHVRAEPRLALAAPAVRVVVGALFAHRHRSLRRRFGTG
ncbi:hypothetical protein PO878_05195 [Iamia majanohamensis]|uniref:Uncharacterized protein n=1 Tax=Iamia majanohamensis TaxID=467976 RepID=A0AAE9YBM5_9ACTN|nr:hypothetical protein [Iamia majanohamensis]WCO68118.1 hypothetical protein PO878_05195 [Iamia majanohamensis]